MRDAIVYLFQDGDAHGWEPWNQISPFQMDGGALKTSSLGNDPYFSSPLFKSSVASVQILMRISAGTQGEVFWVTDDDREWGTQGKSKRFDLIADDQFHIYRIVAQEKRTVLRLRIDPTDAPADVEIQYIAIVPYAS